ncbi:hypothetical protein LIER_40392 [Lithospermum erythrorhizon]|uniref:Uncharacterized protein n=1 Tax=Lithospermum erythrorhizon TaxID=34254 RepID=A0AAV3QXB9_LITER
MVDKAVDCSWKKQVSDQEARTPKKGPSGTKTHGTEELLEVDLHGSRIEKSEPRLVVSEGTEKSAFRDTKYSDGNQASREN